MGKASGGTRLSAPGGTSHHISKSEPQYNITPVKVMKETLSQVAARYVEMGINDIIMETHNFSKAVVVSNVPKEVLEYARVNNIELGRHKIYMNGERVSHTYRDDKHKEISLKALINFPRNLRKMSIYYDTDDKHRNFIFVDGTNKFIVTPNKKVKVYGSKHKGMLYITAETLAINEAFPPGRYVQLK